MSSTAEELPLPDFEIDHQEEYGQFFLTSRAEVLFYLNLLSRRRSIITAYVNDGREFFLSSIVAVDDTEDMVFLDPSQASEKITLAESAKQITLVANLDRVKIEMRLPALKLRSYQGLNTLCTRMPQSMLRLQRREFFRLEAPLAAPIQCKLAAHQNDGSTKTFELLLSDISGGGVSLIADMDALSDFPRDALFQDCRLEIPGEGVIQVNLRVRKVVEVSNRSGNHNLRIGCEFVNLPGTRLTFIERYITRIERERKARDSGLIEF